MATSALRTLIGCGVAAATAAAFNTPLAGVILSIEVVLIEYTVGGFTPILLAAVAGATVGQLVYGSEPAFAVPNVVVGTLWELPWIAAMGLAIGAYAAAFVTLSAKILHATRRTRWWSAWIAAAVIVGTLGLAVPEIMGVGYDVIERTLKSEYSLATVAAIAALKLLATATGAGMRIPAGLIGPTFVMGAALGSVFGLIGTGLVPEGTSNVALYAMLGMAAMMAASLQAPLSALVATVELTGNPHLILPGILAIVTASLSAKHLFQSDSIFVTLRRLQPAQ
jgi:CIC family chloride channel protein